MGIRTEGFTLLELLIVLGIIAILAVAILLTLNPAELLKQSRDSSRLADLGTLRSVTALYLTDVTSPSLTDGANICYISAVYATSTVDHCGNRYTNATVTSTKSGIVSIDGSGWVPINLRLISSGAPIGSLPRDPINDGVTLFYSYAASSSAFGYEFDAKMESSKYSAGGSADKEKTDGGNNDALYEVGTALNY